MPRISGLFLYPVKSCRGFAVSAAEIDALGLVGDRRFLIVDESGKFLTQRTHPRMAQISTALSATTLTLSAESAGAIEVPRLPDPTAPLRRVTIWKHADLQAEDCGPAVAAWLTQFLGVPCGLVRIGPAFTRDVLKKAAQPGDLLTFADAAPLLIVSEASVAHLNDRIVENQGEPVTMDRFRPNVVVTNCAPFAEDTWPSVRLGSAVTLRGAGPSIRCIVTTTDQLTGERGKEPLRTLATFRRVPDEPTSVYFGANFINESKHGTIRVGDAIEVAGK
ncbi:MAG: molybdenum cofactor biosysynthesis protein [Opitutus sp.]|nr:molybdenum cofactor biosysynthesis protein [Opitutus sp.]